MVDSVTWPTWLLKPQDISVDIAPRSLRTQPAQSGFTQAVSNSAGIWRAEFREIPVYSKDMILTWRAISNQAEGMLNQIIIPVWDFRRAPLTSGYTSDDLIRSRGVPHSDGSPFSDGSLYQQGFTSVYSRTAVLAGATDLNVAKQYSGDLQPGHRFSINSRLYEINEIVTQTSTVAAFRIRPPLRDDVAINDRLEFDYPTLKARLASDNEMWLPLNFDQQSFPTVNFFEDV